MGAGKLGKKVKKGVDKRGCECYSKQAVASRGKRSSGGHEKVLKEAKKVLDKAWMVWYSNQAVRVAVADERSEKTSKEVEKRS